MAVIQQQGSGMTIVGVVKVGPQYLSQAWHFVLTEEHVEVPILVDVPARQRHDIRQARAGRPRHTAGLVERAAGRALKEDQSLNRSAQQVRRAVAVKVRDDSRLN